MVGSYRNQTYTKTHRCTGACDQILCKQRILIISAPRCAPVVVLNAGPDGAGRGNGFLALQFWGYAPQRPDKMTWPLMYWLENPRSRKAGKWQPICRQILSRTDPLFPRPHQSSCRANTLEIDPILNPRARGQPPSGAVRSSDPKPRA